MQNLTRNINLGFRVTKEEQEAIKARVAQTKTKNFQTYLLKMAMNGYILNVDLADVRECSRLLRNVSNNTNQITRRANETRSVHANDITDVQGYLAAVWQQQDTIIRKLTKVLEGV